MPPSCSQSIFRLLWWSFGCKMFQLFCKFSSGHWHLTNLNAIFCSFLPFLLIYALSHNLFAITLGAYRNDQTGKGHVICPHEIVFRKWLHFWMKDIHLSWLQLKSMFVFSFWDLYILFFLPENKNIAPTKKQPFSYKNDICFAPSYYHHTLFFLLKPSFNGFWQFF